MVLLASDSINCFLSCLEFSRSVRLQIWMEQSQRSHIHHCHGSVTLVLKILNGLQKISWVSCQIVILIICPVVPITWYYTSFFYLLCLGVMLLPENDSHLTVLLLMGYKSTGYFSRSTNCTFEGHWRVNYRNNTNAYNGHCVVQLIRWIFCGHDWW